MKKKSKLLIIILTMLGNLFISIHVHANNLDNDFLFIDNNISIQQNIESDNLLECHLCIHSSTWNINNTKMLSYNNPIFDKTIIFNNIFYLSQPLSILFRPPKKLFV